MGTLFWAVFDKQKFSDRSDYELCIIKIGKHYPLKQLDFGTAGPWSFDERVWESTPSS